MWFFVFPIQLQCERGLTGLSFSPSLNSPDTHTHKYYQENGVLYKVFYAVYQIVINSCNQIDEATLMHLNGQSVDIITPVNWWVDGAAVTEVKEIRT